MKRLAALIIGVAGVSWGQQAVSLVPMIDSGGSIFRSLSVTNTASQIKATRGQIYSGVLYNGAAAVRFFKFYNAPSASVTVGTTTPIITLPVGAGTNLVIGASTGIKFGTGMSVACTTGVADADTGAPTANDCVANIVYK